MISRSGSLADAEWLALLKRLDPEGEYDATGRPLSPTPAPMIGPARTPRAREADDDLEPWWNR